MNKRICFCLLSFFSLLGPNIYTQVQIGQDIQGTLENECLGYPVSSSGDGNTIAFSTVSCFSPDVTRNVKVYHFDGSLWQQVGDMFEALDSNSFIGGAVSISEDGNRIAFSDIGYSNISSGQSIGRTQVFELNGIWNQLGNDILGDSLQTTSLEGYDMDISNDGNHLISIAPWTYHGQGIIGSARVFEFNGNDWILKGNRIESSNDSIVIGYTSSISKNGNRIALAYDGLPNFNIANPDFVRILEFDGATWNQIGEDIFNANFNLVPVSMELSNDGNRIAIGWHNNFEDIPGLAQVYEFKNGIWTEMGSELTTGENLDAYGISISLSADGNKLAVGAPGIIEDSIASTLGSVYLYEYSGTSWSPTEILLGVEVEADFGRSISLSSNGERIVVGARYKDSNEENAGEVSVYGELSTSGLTENSLFDVSKLLFYPNPATSRIYLVGEIIETKIYDLNGQLIRSYTDENELNLTNLSSGTYVMKLRSPTNLVTKKIIIQN